MRDEVLARFPRLHERLGQAAGSLSGGEQPQMLALVRALMGRPRLLLLDEPSMGLAPLFVDQIFGIIADLKREGTTILLVEQNASAALEVADLRCSVAWKPAASVLEGPAARPVAKHDPTVKVAYYLGMKTCRMARSLRVCTSSAHSFSPRAPRAGPDRRPCLRPRVCRTRVRCTTI